MAEALSGATRHRDDGTAFELPAVPEVAGAFFGDRLPLAEAYLLRLADSGVSHGLIGPREVPRLWERHVLNSAVAEVAFPEGVAVIDVGSGAGLPGIPLAIARPDLSVTLVEPLLRRTTWLEETVAVLGLANVAVCRGKAEAFHGRLSADVVTSRAVSRLANLGAWSGPLVRTGGLMVALKGSSAEAELNEDQASLAAVGLVDGLVRPVGHEVLETPTTLVVLRKVDVPDRPDGRRRDRRPGDGRAKEQGGRRRQVSPGVGAARRGARRRDRDDR